MVLETNKLVEQASAVIACRWFAHVDVFGSAIGVPVKSVVGPGGVGSGS